MKKNLAIFCVALLTSQLGFASADEDRVLEVQWAPTAINAIYLDNQMSEQYCGYEASRYKGCAASADKFAYWTNHNYELSLVNQEFVITKRDLTEKSFRDRQEIKRSKFNEIEKQFSKATVASLIRIYKVLRDENINPRPHHIADSINEFYAVAYDPHQMIQPTAKYDGLNRISQKPYIGITTKKVGNRVGIANVYMNTAAELAGIKPGDVITHVNGNPYYIQPGQTLEDVLTFQNEENVDLTLFRGDHSFKVRVQFGYRALSPVVDRIIKFNKKRYAYLYMREIPSDLDSAKTCDIFSRFVKKLSNENEGMVLDLRGNIGGPGETAACLAGLFVGKDKPIYIDENSNNIVRSVKKSTHPKVFNKKLVVLVNAKTASSGEILSNALQFYSRGLILGDRTFGKAIGQLTDPYDRDTVELYSTVAKAYLPNGVSHQSHGIVPDFYVYRNGLEPSPEEKNILREEDSAMYPLMVPDVKPEVERSAPLTFPKTCVQVDKVKKTVSELKDQDWQKDFQLQFALQTLECSP